MKITQVEKLISDFPEKQIGYRQIYHGIVTNGKTQIKYKRYSNITDIDKDGNIYVTDEIDFITKVDNQAVYLKLEEYLLN
jgi:hypothetical protein